ncbi:CoA ester lyase [Castellaniella sp.]|uniref:HpcH/HpaI aldolase/citrate lyase family protein n=1 Tax=Castellaniella sp. TaxID=1955812 RepID=UPI003566602E
MGFSLMRSALFVPATRLDRVAKAWASGADAVIVDLEDAVAPDAKDTARQQLVGYLQDAPRPVWVRINAGDTDEFEADLAVCRAQAGLAGLVLPKAEHDAALSRATATGLPVMALVETPAGVDELNAIAATSGVQRLCFGILDFMEALGTRPQTAAAQAVLQTLRFKVLLASRRQGLADPLDTVYPDFSDTVGLQAFAQDARDLGFGGMLCIHPRQVPVVHAVHAVSEAEQAWARRVLAHHQQTGSLAFQLDGQMVDQPVISRARRIIAQAGA